MVAVPPTDMVVLARLYHTILAAFVREGGAPHYTRVYSECNYSARPAGGIIGP